MLNIVYNLIKKRFRKTSLILFRHHVVDQSIKNLSAMQETLAGFLGWEDPLEKEMATHSSILAWRIPWTEEACRLQSIRWQESDVTL